MKKILSIFAIALFFGAVLFSACRNDAGTQSTEETTEQAAPAEETQQPAAETQEATNEATPDTTQQQAQ
ncbi:MAG: hypothetical protein KatS3mg030_436 [Saprospiraceae bacterium]|nr:MAG: hypothetical protein KatS3mg030_436 [Saprospiraceae bacterium]